MSVDIKVWEKNSDSSQISQKLCGINLILHRYLWENQNKYERSYNTNWIKYTLANDRLDIFPHFSSLCKCDHPEILNPKRQSNIILVILIIIWHWKVIEGKLLASLTSFVSFVIRYNFRLCPHQFSIGVGNDILYDFRWINNGWHDYWPLLTCNILKDV